ncbi:BTB/POZ domain-containing protein At5g47800 isoform X2 [Cucumis sativus]|uniref:NPH3 domain-containing protein n=1 Tax=Cucumis sativus TaxID=3659 RepID=A0A0A0LYE4_CUCSA|nr:BTB/POZ domain-containing protein At5g47800 isoform X2 [Cucumis sativus]XP_011654672.1 BTB/POZ domain-containing protein At5g47800 isoform X2 [Cucumis sativus]XP_011654678.1 BTB/POZ domain-containing protein At5g47800 isoform X2 [Cucumis sativus]
MKFMKLGTRPDTFHTQEATRTVISETPSDLIIKINNITYLIHKFPVVAKCGLLQRLCSNHSSSNNNGDEKIRIELHEIPGGGDGFELCAKFCYGITINLSAHNFVSAFCAANFLGMNESTDEGNFISKLESFFISCILCGWKDSILTLCSSVGVSEWCHNLGITSKCIDSIVHKILTPPPKVTWSYTYTRLGYNKKNHRSVPKDWWTEDIADLDIDLFRCIMLAISSTCILPPPLIGEALHVYTCRWLSDVVRDTSTSDNVEKNRQIIETIISLIPPDRESVSVSFSLRLHSLANVLGASQVTKAEIIRRCSLLLEEATVKDLLFSNYVPKVDDNGQCLKVDDDVDLVVGVLESYLMMWRRNNNSDDDHVENEQLLRSIRKVGKLIDCYLQVVGRDRKMSLAKMICVAEALPDLARPSHDHIYKAINIFLKEHPDISKAEKKRLCRVLNCQKLSPELRSHAVKNERLPLRTVVQVLFFEQEMKGSKTSRQGVVEGTLEEDEWQDEMRSEPKERPGSGDPMRPWTQQKLRRSESTRSSRPNGKEDQKMKASELIKKSIVESRRKVVVHKGEERGKS